MMEDNPVTPGQRIKQERENMGLSQEELAEKIGCSSQQVKRWEKDEAFPQPALRRKLSTYFGKSIEELGLVPLREKVLERVGALSEQSAGTTFSTDTPEQDSTETGDTGQVVINTSDTGSERRDRRLHMSRRTILTGLGLAAVAGGGVAWWLLAHEPAAQSPKDAYGKYVVATGGTRYQVFALAWSPDGKFIAAGTQDTSPRVWDISSGEQLHTYYEAMRDPIDAITWSPDGAFIAGGGADYTVRVWNAFTGRTMLNYKGHTRGISFVAWSPDGRYIASSGADRKVLVWEATTGNTICTYTGHTELVWVATWSHDSSRITSGGEDNTVHVWDAKTGNNAYIYHSHTGTINDVEWSPDDTLIASASDDKTVRVWNVTSGKTIYTYRGHSVPVHAVSWSPDGVRLASGGGKPTNGTPVANGTPQVAGDNFAVHTWDATTGQNVHKYIGHTDTLWTVVWSPKGTFIASGSDDCSIRIWSVS